MALVKFWRVSISLSVKHLGKEPSESPLGAAWSKKLLSPSRGNPIIYVEVDPVVQYLSKSSGYISFFKLCAYYRNWTLRPNTYCIVQFRGSGMYLRSKVEKWKCLISTCNRHSLKQTTFLLEGQTDTGSETTRPLTMCGAANTHLYISGK